MTLLCERELPQEVKEALLVVKRQARAHRPRKGSGRNEEVATRVRCMQDALTHSHCASCDAFRPNVTNGRAVLRCAVGYSPVELWGYAPTDGVPLGDEPQCLGYSDE